MEKTALLIIDVQNDFCPGGALPVENGNLILEPVNDAIQIFKEASLPIFASRDWHPPQSRHFREQGGEWPPHCIEGTLGAAFHPSLRLPFETVIISKGVDPELNGYSPFEEVGGSGALLRAHLLSLQVQRLCICGLATDYCVLNSVLDALQTGFTVTVLTDAVAAVDLYPGDGTAALVKMSKAGAQLSSVKDLAGLLSP